MVFCKWQLSHYNPMMAPVFHTNWCRISQPELEIFADFRHWQRRRQVIGRHEQHGYLLLLNNRALAENPTEQPKVWVST
jgi:hypothetical protein